MRYLFKNIQKFDVVRRMGTKADNITDIKGSGVLRAGLVFPAVPG